jgi:hypothetical protein
VSPTREGLHDLAGQGGLVPVFAGFPAGSETPPCASARRAASSPATPVPARIGP